MDITLLYLASNSKRKSFPKRLSIVTAHSGPAMRQVGLGDSLESVLSLRRLTFGIAESHFTFLVAIQKVWLSPWIVAFTLLVSKILSLDGKCFSAAGSRVRIGEFRAKASWIGSKIFCRIEISFDQENRDRGYEILVRLGKPFCCINRGLASTGLTSGLLNKTLRFSFGRFILRCLKDFYVRAFPAHV